MNVLELVLDVMILGTIATVVGGGGSLIGMVLYGRYSQSKLLKKYNPHDDIGRKAEENRSKGGRERIVTPTSKDVGVGEIPNPEIVFPSGTIAGTGEDSKSVRGFFGKFRKK